MFDVSIEDLRKMLAGRSPVFFWYVKNDGELRKAKGTLHESRIPEELKPKDSSTNNGKNLKYFDMEKKAWRSLPSDCSIVTILE